jgi:hypothetical protein
MHATVLRFRGYLFVMGMSVTSLETKNLPGVRGSISFDLHGEVSYTSLRSVMKNSLQNLPRAINKDQ